MGNSEGKLKGLLDRVIEESKNKGITINCKKRKFMVVSKKKTAEGTLESSRWRNVLVWVGSNVEPCLSTSRKNMAYKRSVVHGTLVL